MQLKSDNINPFGGLFSILSLKSQFREFDFRYDHVGGI